MAVIPAPASPTHELPGTRFTSLATPSRGNAETAVWQVEIDPDAQPTPHTLTREEVFVVLEGTATVGGVGNDAISVGVGVVAYLALAFAFHPVVIGMPVFGA